ncbi:hypothetical protein [Sorangium sp. So ce388]|uniref:hypothetical protein n=1 Tax=Sorangium sp. So ce388 TaxID=3133309 RepID=UPI003F5B801F
MKKKKNRPQKDARNPITKDRSQTANSKSSTQQLTPGFILRAVIPGGLMYQMPHPPGVPAVGHPRSAHLYTLKKAPVLKDLPRAELDALIESLAATYTRAAYHEFRFMELRRELDMRRANMPGEILFDSLVEFVHFELQAFAGASRMLLDELVYLIARRHGVPVNRAKRKPWETSDLIQKPRTADCDVPEIRLLASKSSWFGTLNAYRNSFFHHGWRHGGGHFSPDDIRSAAASPASNGLLVPDKSSLGSRSKPFEWTWGQRTTVDDIAKEIRTGTEDLLTNLLENLWSMPPPHPGTAPLEERPNVLIVLAKPAFVETDGAIFLPVFSSRELGLSFHHFSTHPNLELADVPVSSAVIGQKAVTVSLSGIEKNSISKSIEFIDIVLDPNPNNDWTHVETTAHARIPLRKLLDSDTVHPVSLPVHNLDRAWVWRSAMARTWST